MHAGVCCGVQPAPTQSGAPMTGHVHREAGVHSGPEREGSPQGRRQDRAPQLPSRETGSAAPSVRRSLWGGVNNKPKGRRPARGQNKPSTAKGGRSSGDHTSHLLPTPYTPPPQPQPHRAQGARPAAGHSDSQLQAPGLGRHRDSKPAPGQGRSYLFLASVYRQIGVSVSRLWDARGIAYSSQRWPRTWIQTKQTHTVLLLLCTQPRPVAPCPF